MTHLVHVGGGRTVTLASSAYEDPTLERPPKTQRPKRPQNLPQAMIPRPWLHKFKPTPPKAYGPVKFIDMASDQCGWILPSGYRCGQKVHKPGASLCGHHHAVAHGRAKPFREAAE